MPDQFYLGRCVIVLKRKCGALADLTKEEVIDFWENVVKKLEAAFKRSFGAVMFNWTCMMNDAYKNDPPDPQVHWHLRPRYDRVVEFEGETFTDPNFGHHYERHTERVISEDVRRKIIKKLQGNIF